MKRILLFSFCIFTGFSFSFENRSSYPGVVLLTSKNRKPIGTGFFIQPDILATVFHNIKNFKGPIKEALFFIDPIENISRPVTEILALDMESDLALLKTEGYQSDTFYPVSIPDKVDSVSISNEVLLPGFPHGRFHLVHGRTRGNYDTVLYVRIENTNGKRESFSGISGAPILSKESHLEGIVIIEDMEYLLFPRLGFISVEKLRNLGSRPRLSCLTSSCIDEEKERWQSQALKGDKRSQFVMGLWEYHFANTEAQHLLRVSNDRMSLAASEAGKKQIAKRILDALFQIYQSPVRWLTQAAHQGHAEAQFLLAGIYGKGDGVKQDRERALYWLEQAAHQCHVQAQFLLGWVYVNGDGVTQNFKEGFDWFHQAALQGHIDAQLLLSEVCAKETEMRRIPKRLFKACPIHN